MVQKVDKNMQEQDRLWRKEKKISIRYRKREAISF